MKIFVKSVNFQQQIGHDMGGGVRLPRQAVWDGFEASDQWSCEMTMDGKSDKDGEKLRCA